MSFHNGAGCAFSNDSLLYAASGNQSADSQTRRDTPAAGRDGGGNPTMKKSKKLCLTAATLAAMLSLTACDPTKRKKPYNFPGSLWVCQELPACIAVTEQEAYSYSYGEIELDGKVIPLTMVYMIANEGAFLDFNKAHLLETIWTPNIEDDKYLWRGVVTYSRTEFTLETTAEGRSYPLLSDDLPLTFVRYDLTEEELLPLLPWDAEENLREDFEPGKLLELGMDVCDAHDSLYDG